MEAPFPRPGVFLTSVPKAGAHLLVKVLERLGYTRGCRPLGSSALFGRRRWLKVLVRSLGGSRGYLVLGVELATPVRAGWVVRRLAGIRAGTYGRGHVRHSEHFRHLLGERGLACVHLVRDPRDVAVSHAHYATGHRRHVLHRWYRSLPSWEERLAFSIRGGPVPGLGFLESLAGRFRAMEGWREDPAVLDLRFEDLIGETGGGSTGAQGEALARLAAHLGVAAGPERLAVATTDLFGGTRTFRRGEAGSWRDAFSPAHRDLFRRCAPGLAAAWGYPED